jgi:hypothetical protein
MSYPAYTVQDVVQNVVLKLALSFEFEKYLRPFKLYVCVCVCVYARARTHTHTHTYIYLFIRGCSQEFLDRPPGARTTNGTALCH